MLPLLALVLTTTAPARASTLIDYWSYGSYVDGSSMVGVDGWTTGYSRDTWIGYLSRTSGNYYVYSSTDDNGGSFGSGEAMDNWLVNSEVAVEDGVLRVPAYTTDDDTLGIVFRFQDAQNYYMLLLCEGASGGDNPLELGCPFMGLVRVQDGTATVLNSTTATYTVGTVMGLELLVDGSYLRGRLWTTEDATWAESSSTATLTASDPSPVTGLGAAGFYAYNAGGDPRSETMTAFGTIAVYQVDEDADTVADDVDNCETVANPDQADADNDGTGDLCDDTPGTDTGSNDTDTGSADSGDSGTDSGSTDTSDSGADTSDSGGGLDTGTGPNGIHIPAGKLTTCACSSGPRAASGWFGVAGLAALLARRRRSSRA